MVTTIEIKRENRNPSRVIVGDTLAMLPGLLPPGRRVVVIVDRNVFELYGDVVAGYEHIVVPSGEQNKTLTTVGEIYRQLVASGADRKTYIVGFGGGITTDIAGFVASTYLRGVEFGFVATSLLAQVDASVGGKNGVNVDGGGIVQSARFRALRHGRSENVAAERVPRRVGRDDKGGDRRRCRTVRDIGNAHTRGVVSRPHLACRCHCKGRGGAQQSRRGRDRSFTR